MAPSPVTPANSTYGKAFLDDQTQLTRELWCVQQKLTPEEGGLGPGRHLALAANLLFPVAAFQPNRWSDHRAETVMQQEFTVWWGPGASAKTTDAARVALTYWCAAPHRTLVIVCSTTAAMLDKRVWGELKRLHSAMVQPIGTLRKSDREIVFEQATEAGENSKNVIRGVAILQGTLEEAMGNILGQHNDRVFLVVDEAQVSREALIEARINLRKGTQDFRILLIGNPTSRTDPLGSYSEPEQGWDWFYKTLVRKPYTYLSAKTGQRVTVQMPIPSVTTWRTTKGGQVHLYHGFDAPTMDSPEDEKRLPFLIKRSEIEADIDEYGPEHARTYTYGLGILPPEGAENKPFTNVLFSATAAQQKVVWRTPTIRLAAADPSFSTGGDKFMFQEGNLGVALDGTVRMEFATPEHIKPNPAPNEPLEDFYYRAVAKKLQARGIDIENFILDVSGSHNSMLSGIERAYGRRGAVGINGRNKPTFLRLARDEARPAREVVGNLRTECWELLKNFLRFGHLAGVNPEAIREFCAAAYKENPERSRGLLQLIDKKEMKQALGKSPDDADAKALLCYLLRARFGIIPGVHVLPPNIFQQKFLATSTKPVIRMPIKYGIR